ncbi:MAG: tyrosine-type recombinase/integrase [Lachnospiraceae bacterium]|nr:tyrosine-type recombinase/integrase [Lachnospiraceae bacterium]
MALQIPIVDGTKAVMDFCRDNRSQETIKMYEKACDRVIRLYKEHTRSIYDADFHDSLIKQYVECIVNDVQHNLWFERLVFRVLSMIKDYFSNIPFREKYYVTGRFKHGLSPYFESWCEDFRVTLKQKPLTISTINSIARDFFYFLQIKEISDFSIIDNSIFYDFLSFEYNDHSGCMNNVCYVTKLIMSFLRERGYDNIPVELVPFALPPKRNKVLPALDSNDIKSIIESIDPDSNAGKRDYAILMLATYTGLRSIDIANLHLEDINWNDLTIKLSQHKTSVRITLPLDAGVASAVADYIIHARPETDERCIFLTVNKPFRKLNDRSSVANIFNKYMKVSCVDKKPFDGKSFHAIRRSMGAWLLNSGAKPELISQILGHKDKNILKRYLPIEKEALRICALDFSQIPLRSEVFI